MGETSNWYSSGDFAVVAAASTQLVLSIDSPAEDGMVFPRWSEFKERGNDVLVVPVKITADGGPAGLEFWQVSVNNQTPVSGTWNMRNATVLLLTADGTYTVYLSAQQKGGSIQSVQRTFQIDLDAVAPSGGRMAFPVAATYAYCKSGEPANGRLTLTFEQYEWVDVGATNNSGLYRADQFDVTDADDDSAGFEPVSGTVNQYCLPSGKYRVHGYATDCIGNRATTEDVIFRVNIPPADIPALTDVTVQTDLAQVQCPAIDETVHEAEGLIVANEYKDQAVSYIGEVWTWINGAAGKKIATLDGSRSGDTVLFDVSHLSYTGEMRWRVRASDGLDYSSWAWRDVFTQAVSDYTLTANVSPAGPQDAGQKWTFTVRASDGRKLDAVSLTSDLEGTLSPITAANQADGWRYTCSMRLYQEGTHQVMATGTDASGTEKNAAITLDVNSSASIDFSLDAQAEPASGKADTTFTIRVAAGDRRQLSSIKGVCTDASVGFFTNLGQAPGWYSTSLTLSEAGSYEIVVTAKDAAGTTGQGSVTLSVQAADQQSGGSGDTGGGGVEPDPPVLDSIRLLDADGDVVDPERFTNKRTVTVEMNVSGGAPVQMRLNGGSWITYQNPTTYQLSDGDGEKTVTCQLRNVWGVSALQSATIILDTTPIEPFVVIPSDPVTGNRDITKNTSIVYSLIVDSSLDPSKLKMRLRSTGDVSGPSLDQWTNYSAGPNTLILMAGDGDKDITVEIADENNNIRAASASIELDQTPPVFTGITIFDLTQLDKTITNDQNVLVAIDCDDTAAQYTLSENSGDLGTVNAPWQKFSASVPFRLSTGDATKTVYSKVRDRAGNESVVRSASIALKTTAPVLGSMTLSDTTAAGSDDKADAGYTNDRTINVAITVSSGAGDIQAVRLREPDTGIDTGWLTDFTLNGSAVSLTYQLSSGDGIKTVSAQLRDSTKENISNSVSAMIVLDTEAPTATISVDTPTAQAAVNLFIDAPKADYMRLVSDGSDAASWAAGTLDTWLAVGQGTVALTIDDTEDGSKDVQVQFKDAAGNLSAVYTATTVLDSTILGAPQNLDSDKADNAQWCNAVTVHTFTWGAPANVGASGIREYLYTVDGTEPLPGGNSTGMQKSFTFDPPDKSGTYTIKVRAVSNSGLAGAVATFLLQLDTDKPRVS